MCTNLGKFVLKSISLSAGLAYLKRKEIFALDVNRISNDKLRECTESYFNLGEYVLEKTCELLEIRIEGKNKANSKFFLKEIELSECD
ncbi:hypothetical protein M0813_05411 [Anaeramoeba flamelloides]|uniref:Uncharacterized protein n=1 Tax=Anaeramoeba flamelloides TaxID=1746091 RepID=A0ABQ8XGZ6_9EUKA|nr:hypothetical protein M0813_05411 [Anaeramoeba flamelloides]